MIYQDRFLPLSVNRPVIEYMEQVRQKEVGNTLEGGQYREDWRLRLAHAEAQGRNEFLHEYKRYAGEIINKDIDLMLYAQSIAASMLEIVPINGFNIPSYTLWTTPEVEITRMAGHGRPPSVVKYMDGTMYFPALYKVASSKIYQYLPDILTGEQGPNSKIDTRARYEIAQTIEDDIWTMVAAACGTFTAASTWVYDTRIQNVPTTNDFDYSAAGGLTIGLFRSIMAAVDLIPSRTRPNQSARIRNILIPHVAAQDIRTWVSVVSNVSAAIAGSSNDNATIVTPELHRQIEESGPMIEQLFGENVGIVKVNRLMGTSVANFSKFLYVILDEPIGRLYVRPESDRMDTLDDRLPEAVGFVASKDIGMEIPDPYAPNFMRVQFTT